MHAKNTSPPASEDELWPPVSVPGHGSILASFEPDSHPYHPAASDPKDLALSLVYHSTPDFLSLYLVSGT